MFLLSLSPLRFQAAYELVRYGTGAYAPGREWRGSRVATGVLAVVHMTCGAAALLLLWLYALNRLPRLGARPAAAALWAASGLAAWLALGVKVIQTPLSE
jgi:hypothetical protein